MALGGTRELVDACVATRLGEVFGNDAFWLSVIRWFIAYPSFDLNQVGPVVDFIHHVKFDCSYTLGEFTPALQPGFSMAGRTPDALLRRMERWHAGLHRDGGAQADTPEIWAAPGIHGLRWERRTRRVATAWAVEALLSTGALVREGREMRHCVASYARNCAAGDCSIWSVKAAVGSLVMQRWTVEVNGDGVIVQVRGKSNRAAGEEVLDVLRRWAARENLSMATGL